nr:hypothetical protein [candidate division Zixibacteria bacterium]
MKKINMSKPQGILTYTDVSRYIQKNEEATRRMDHRGYFILKHYQKM